MDEAQTVRSMGGGDANPVDTTGLCLLSLDGGGVRGLSTLHVLKDIMDQLNYERKKSGLDPVKPCDVFDLIGGTSTGGLIAIMLGRLEMDVDECIAAYNELSVGVFAKPQRRISVDIGGRVAPRFDSTKLKDAILMIIASRGLPPDALFDDGEDRGCKIFVCAASKDLNGIERLRSYSYPWKRFPPCTICEAALATSAASGFFHPVQIGARQYVDGALGANNPVEQVESEASDFWCRENGDLKPLVKCFVSIGTGNPGKKPIEDRVDKFISETLVGIATETEKTAALFIKRWRQHYHERRFFRFNVEQGLQEVGLAEHDKRGIIETATAQYMTEAAQESRVRECVQNLKEKQSRPEEGLVGLVEVGQLTVLCLALAHDA
jgi:predicted acylesterase/phospholipase RssA